MTCFSNIVVNNEKYSTNILELYEKGGCLLFLYQKPLNTKSTNWNGGCQFLKDFKTHLVIIVYHTAKTTPPVLKKAVYRNEA